MSGRTDAFSLAKSHTSGPPQGPLPNGGAQNIVNLTGKPFHITGAQPFRDRLLVPSRPAKSEPGRAAGDKPPPYRNDGTDALAMSMKSDPIAH